MIIQAIYVLSFKYKRKYMLKELGNAVDVMKKVKNVDSLKKFIQTCDFWADTWAISTLEQILNIKLVILSSESYSSDDIDNVLLCIYLMLLKVYFVSKLF